MTLEYAGAVDVQPPLTNPEIAYLQRLSDEVGTPPMAWAAARDGGLLRPRSGADLEDCVESMRRLLLSMDRPSRFRGMVAAYDPGSRELVAITVSRGRVTRRSLHGPSRIAERRPPSNVVDLAARRRPVSRAIS